MQTLENRNVTAGSQVCNLVCNFHPDMQAFQKRCQCIGDFLAYLLVDHSECGRAVRKTEHWAWKLETTLQVRQNTNWNHQQLTTRVRRSSNNCCLKQCSAPLIINLEPNPISTWSRWRFMQTSGTLLLIVSSFPAQAIKLLIKWAVWSKSSDQMAKSTASDDTCLH